MSDTQEPEVPEEESFADLLECYSSGMKDDLHIGDEVEGKIISIGKDTVFVDTGTKVDGAVDREELLGEEGEMPFSEGDVVTLYVVGMDDSQIRLSKAISGVGGLAMLREALENRVPVDGKVSESCKGGYRVRMMQRSAFCPGSQIDIRPGPLPRPTSDRSIGSWSHSWTNGVATLFCPAADCSKRSGRPPEKRFYPKYPKAIPWRERWSSSCPTAPLWTLDPVSREWCISPSCPGAE